MVIHLPLLLTKSGLSVAAMSHEPCSTPSSQTRKIEVFDVCHGMRRNAKGSEELLEAGPESGTGSLPQPLFWAEVLKSQPHQLHKLRLVNLEALVPRRLKPGLGSMTASRIMEPSAPHSVPMSSGRTRSLL